MPASESRAALDAVIRIAPPPTVRRWGIAAPQTTACARTLIAHERSSSLDRHGLRRSGDLDAEVRPRGVEAAELAGGLVDEAADGLRVGSVEDDGGRVEVAREGAQRGSVHVAEDQAVLLRGQ